MPGTGVTAGTTVNAGTTGITVSSQGTAASGGDNVLLAALGPMSQITVTGWALSPGSSDVKYQWKDGAGNLFHAPITLSATASDNRIRIRSWPREVCRRR